MVLEHFRNLEFLRVIKSRALEMPEIIVISEHSQKSLTSKSLDFDSRQNSVSSEVSEAVRILIKNSEVYSGVGDFANFYDCSN